MNPTNLDAGFSDSAWESQSRLVHLLEVALERLLDATFALGIVLQLIEGLSQQISDGVRRACIPATAFPWRSRRPAASVPNAPEGASAHVSWLRVLSGIM